MKIAIRIILLGLIVSGCGGGQASAPDTVIIPTSGGGDAAATSPSHATTLEGGIMSAQTTAPPGAAPQIVKTVERAALSAFLERGPTYALKHVPVQPMFRDGRFAGYQVESFFKDDPQVAADAGIQPGDVIVRVNGQSVERPEDFFSVWQNLKTADHFTIDLLRGGAPLTLKWEVNSTQTGGAGL